MLIARCLVRWCRKWRSRLKSRPEEISNGRRWKETPSWREILCVSFERRLPFIHDALFTSIDLRDVPFHFFVTFVSRIEQTLLRRETKISRGISLAVPVKRGSFSSCVSTAGCWYLQIVRLLSVDVTWKME